MSRTREIQVHRGESRILKTGEVAVHGEIASLNTADGLYYAGQALTTLLPMGYFAEALTGDGVLTVRVEFFEPLTLHGFVNDPGGGAVTEADIGSEVFILNPTTVTLTSSGNSKAGRAHLLQDSLVWINSGSAVTGPTGSSNTSVALQNKNVHIGLGDLRLASGAVVPAFVDAGADGFDTADSEAHGVRWNNVGTPAPFSFTFAMPEDIDTTLNAKLHVTASKTGATLADAVTFTFTLFNQAPGALHDADADYGSATSAMVGDATAKTVATVFATLVAANLDVAVGTCVSGTIQPTDGTLDVDDVIIYGLRLEYTPRAL